MNINRQRHPAGVIAGLAIATAAAGVCAQQTEQLSLPNVTVTAPAAPAVAPYLRDPGKGLPAKSL